MPRQLSLTKLVERLAAVKGRSAYKNMWLIAMFDLPVDTKENRKNHARFRKDLKKLGFDRLQYSVYAYFSPTEDVAAVLRANIRRALPPRGHVRLLMVTDRQFGNMDCYEGKRTVNPLMPPEQVLLL